MSYRRFGISILVTATVGVGLGLIGQASAAGQPAPQSNAAMVPSMAKRPSNVLAQAPAGHPQGQAQSQANFGTCYPFGCDYRGPSYPFGYARPQTFAAPNYAAPSPHRHWVAPHWGRQWVPQYSVYQVWVPGYFCDQGWVPGYYEDRTVESGGYYQQVWLNGYWDD